MTVVTFTDPAPTSDAGIVLQAITRRPGIPAWAVARNGPLSLERVWSSIAYLRTRGKIHARPAPFACPRTQQERPFKCWYPGAAVTRGQQIGERCSAPLGYRQRCDARLVEWIDRLGQARYACPKCERRAQGLCRRCPQPLAPKAQFGPAPWYCPACEHSNRRTRAREKYRERAGVKPEAMRV